jgi:UDP-N-acetylglucosamine transferase subunit ALG13
MHQSKVLKFQFTPKMCLFQQDFKITVCKHFGIKNVHLLHDTNVGLLMVHKLTRYQRWQKQSHFNPA